MRVVDFLLPPEHTHMQKHIPLRGHAAHAATADSKTSSHMQRLTMPQTSKQLSILQVACAYLVGTDLGHQTHSLPFLGNYKLPCIRNQAVLSKLTQLLCKF